MTGCLPNVDYLFPRLFPENGISGAHLYLNDQSKKSDSDESPNFHHKSLRPYPIPFNIRNAQHARTGALFPSFGVISQGKYYFKTMSPRAIT